MCWQPQVTIWLSIICWSLFFKATPVTYASLPRTHTLFYKSFPPLSSPHVLSSWILETEKFIYCKQWYAAWLKSVQTRLDGLHYLQTYDCVLIWSIISTTYLGWATYGALYALSLHQEPSIEDSNTPMPVFIIRTAISAVALLMTIISWILFALQQSLWTILPVHHIPLLLLEPSITEGSPKNSLMVLGRLILNRLWEGDWSGHVSHKVITGSGSTSVLALSGTVQWLWI